MTVRVLFLGEGTSDNGVVPHIESTAIGLGIGVTVTNPDLGRLNPPPGRAVKDKLQAALAIGGQYDLIVIHRDSDRDGRPARLAEIADAVAATAPGIDFSAVIPVRMTEAWLLTDEREIRQVAGNPTGRMQLSLPVPARVETLPDPKRALKEMLALASGLSGRRLVRFHDRFSQHRRQLLERLDPAGRIREVPSWRHFMADLTVGLQAAVARRSAVSDND